MASWTDSDGIAVERPVARKSRGRSLTLEQSIRLRDLLGALLVLELGLSIPDALAVLGLCPVTQQHLRRRLRMLPPNVTRIFQELSREVAHGTSGSGVETGHGEERGMERIGRG